MRRKPTRSLKIETVEKTAAGMPDLPSIRVTQTPLGEDPNILLQKGKSLIAIFTKAVPAELSFEGACRRLAGMEGLDREHERYRIGKHYEARTAAVDREVSIWERAAAKAKEEPSDKPEDAEKPPEDPPWEGDINIAAALETVVTEMRRSVAAPEHYFHIAALWSAASHLVPMAHLKLQVMPQLGVQSDKDIGENAGKSILLEAVTTVSYRGELRSSYTPATVFRSIAAEQKTFALVDVHNHDLRDPSELKQIINACHKRAEAKIDRCEKLEDGRIVVRTYPCWAAIAWSSIGPLPREIESRAIILKMKRALPDEFGKLDKAVSPSDSQDLIDARRHIAAWAKTIVKLPGVTLGLVNRSFDNWRLLYQVAHLVGGVWPARANEALDKLTQVRGEPALPMRLLEDIKEFFDKNPEKDRFTSGEIIAALVEDEENGWREVNHGRPVNAWCLGRWLKGLTTPPKEGAPAGSYKWEGTDPQKGEKVNCRGYLRVQFVDSFTRYLSVPPDLTARTASRGAHHLDLTGEKGLAVTDLQPPAQASQPPAGEKPPSPGPQPPAAHPHSGEPDQPSYAPSAGGHSASAGGQASPAGGYDKVQPPADLSADIKGLDPSLAVMAVKTTSEEGSPAQTNGGEIAKTPTKSKGNGRKKGNGQEKNQDIPTPYTAVYRQGSIAEAIHQLRASHPNRSLAWIAKQIGQPKSVVEAVLGTAGSKDPPS